VKRALLSLAASSALVTLGLACRVAGVPQGPSALIFGITALAGTAVYRAATDGCWAACNTGWVCNTATGRCEPQARERQQRLLRPAENSDASAPTQASAATPADAGASASVDPR
jgi:hypothetical protein